MTDDYTRFKQTGQMVFLVYGEDVDSPAESWLVGVFEDEPAARVFADERNRYTLTDRVAYQVVRKPVYVVDGPAS